MSEQLKYIIVLLFMVILAAAQTANAQSISVELAEKTPPADPGDPMTTTTTSTTSTTTTLPTIPMCPDTPIPGATALSDSGYNYWSFTNSQQLCSLNPTVKSTASKTPT